MKKTKAAQEDNTRLIEVEVEPTLSDDALEEILHIAQKRAALVGELKEALLREDIEKVKVTARRLCGLDSSGSETPL